MVRVVGDDGTGETRMMSEVRRVEKMIKTTKRRHVSCLVINIDHNLVLHLFFSVITILVVNYIYSRKSIYFYV